MRILTFKRLLGLGAIAGGIHYMQKKRGGDMSFKSISDNFRGLISEAKTKFSNMNQVGGSQGVASQVMGSENDSSLGYSGSAGIGSNVGGDVGDVGSSVGSGVSGTSNGFGYGGGSFNGGDRNR